MPKWMLYLKIAILFFSLVILAVSAYGVSITYGYSGAAGYMVFITVKTLLIFGAAVAVELLAPQLFFRILAFVVYLLSIIFWLSGWAWAASWAAAAWSGYYNCSRGGACSNYGAALAAVAALGAFTWILSIVHLVFFVKFCMANPQQTTPGNAELGNVKPEQQPYVTAAQYPAGQPAGQYPQQQQQPYQQ